MVREIVHDPLFLAIKSEKATINDKQVAIDLLDTLKAHLHECVGMAANMIGINKKIIVVSAGFIQFVMINPEIVSKKRPYKTEEGCLSLSGKRPTTRFEEITVKYLDINFKEQKSDYKGFLAQIIQHECDHLEGVLI